VFFEKIVIGYSTGYSILMMSNLFDFFFEIEFSGIGYTFFSYLSTNLIISSINIIISISYSSLTNIDYLLDI